MEQEDTDWLTGRDELGDSESGSEKELGPETGEPKEQDNAFKLLMKQNQPLPNKQGELEAADLSHPGV